MVGDTVKTMRVVAPGFEISCAVHDVGVPLIVNADARRIEQVVNNLLSNAVKYSFSSRNVDVTVGMQEGQPVVSVRDYGLGIPANEQHLVFERFFRASNISPYQHQGLGLGLFLSYGIVLRHGGRMWVEL